jgi:large subunit ribosomal protein L9
MQVILIQDVNNLGGANELVTVKNGYGRNFLIPKKLAVEANPSNMKMMEERLNTRIRWNASQMVQ